MAGLISELKRRNVFRVSIAYVAVSWLLLQVVATVLPIYGAPDWVAPVFTLMLALGFPVALLLAWAYQLTPEGVQRDKGAAGEPVRRSKVASILIIFTLAVAAFIFFTNRTTDDTATLGLEPSVAVIPFPNLSNDPSADSLAAGIHDDLLTQISRIGSIKTISRTSVMQYRDTNKTIPEIAAELGVATILEGGVQRSGDRIRVNAQLIDAATDDHLWAETYDRQMTADNIFAIQTDIARAIAGALRATLTDDEQERLDRIPTHDLNALERYFQGKQLLEDRNERSLRAAVSYFEEVVQYDPDFAMGYSGLADALMLLPEYTGNIDPADIRARSAAAISRAFELDPEIPEVLTSMGWNKLIHEYDWASAEKLLARAVEIQPNNTGALHWYSHVLSWQRRHEHAVAVARTAVAIDPKSRLMNMNLAYILVDDGQYDEALSLATRTVASNPDFTSQLRNLWLHEMRAGNIQAGAQGLRKWAVVEGRDVAAAEGIGDAFVQYHQTGVKQELSDELVTRLELSSEDLAQVYAFVGDSERAIRAIDVALEERSGSRSVLSMKINVAYDFMRDDPRFIDLMRLAGML